MDRTLNRRDTIVELLRSYPDAVSPLNGGAGVLGDGESEPRMSREWRAGSYDELEYCLAKMKKLGKQYAYQRWSWRTLHLHIVMWWINVEQAQRQTHERIAVGKGRKKKSMLVPRHYVETLRHKDANEQKAQWGVDVINDVIWTGLAREPRLPVEAYERLAA